MNSILLHYGGFSSAKGSNAHASKSIGMFGGQTQEEGAEVLQKPQEEVRDINVKQRTDTSTLCCGDDQLEDHLPAENRRQNEKINSCQLGRVGGVPQEP